jgi:hypothetical protein
VAPSRRKALDTRTAPSPCARACATIRHRAAMRRQVLYLRECMRAAARVDLPGRVGRRRRIRCQSRSERPDAWSAGPAARTTRSKCLRSPCARSATSRSSRTTCVPHVGTTRARKSSRPTRRPSDTCSLHTGVRRSRHERGAPFLCRDRGGDGRGWTSAGSSPLIAWPSSASVVMPAAWGARSTATSSRRSSQAPSTP